MLGYKKNSANVFHCLYKIENHPLLNNHPLDGIWIGCRSINITGDFRAVYEELGNDNFEFVAIGTHSEFIFLAIPRGTLGILYQGDFANVYYLYICRVSRHIKKFGILIFCYPLFVF